MESSLLESAKWWLISKRRFTHTFFTDYVFNFAQQKNPGGDTGLVNLTMRQVVLGYILPVSSEIDIMQNVI